MPADQMHAWACLGAIQMTDPNVQLREYLDKLIHRFLNIRSMSQQLKAILGWQSPTRIETLNRGYYFFGLATYSLSRIIFTELSMLLSPREERSLSDWLKKAKDHAAKLKPTRYNPEMGEHEFIEIEQYRSLIDGQSADLALREDTIKRMKARRDKAIAHMDKKYFDDPQALFRDYPLSDSELEDLMELAGGILRKHYSCLFQADIRIEVTSVHTVDAVLEYTRAFMRARRDFDLIKMGFNPTLYLREDYEEKTGKTET